MAALFPSSLSTPKCPLPSTAFDPTLQCVAFHQKQKKKAVRVKATKVTIVLVNSTARSLPKGKHLNDLEKSNCTVKLNIYCTMSALQVKNTILEAFAHLHLESFVYLRVDPSHRFMVDSVQSKDGNMIADIGGKAKFYIKESTDVSHSYIRVASNNYEGLLFT